MYTFFLKMGEHAKSNVDFDHTLLAVDVANHHSKILCLFKSYFPRKCIKTCKNTC